MKDEKSRAIKLSHLKDELSQAIQIIDLMSATPNQPMIITDKPMWGINVLEKLNAIEIFDDATKTHSIGLDDDGENILRPLTMAIARS